MPTRGNVDAHARKVPREQAHDSTTRSLVRVRSEPISTVQRKLSTIKERHHSVPTLINKPSGQQQLQRLAGNSLPNLRSSGATVLDQTPPHHRHSASLREAKSKDFDSKRPSSSAALLRDKQHSSPALSSASAFYSNVVTWQVAKASE